MLQTLCEIGFAPVEVLIAASLILNWRLLSRMDKRLYKLKWQQELATKKES
ncbi:hypothetical protein [Agarivorans litoreus]|uniref:hypothetical protein n=1 Tax=Agarivorans litoreus TaxID=1510455 RepID=UPI001C7D2FCE|nr:hypothetical protein [Agarivorans litoreus]